MIPVAYSNTFMNNMLRHYNNRLVCCINIHYITFVTCGALSVTVLYCIHITKERTTVSNLLYDIKLLIGLQPEKYESVFK